MKIIKINNCGQCPFVQSVANIHSRCLVKNYLLEGINPSIPDWCPLDDMPESLFELWLDASKERKKNDR